MKKPESTGPPTITLTVFEPSDPDPREFTWTISTKVGDAADQAAKAFGLTADLPSLQNGHGDVLDRNKTLVAEGVKDGDELTLVNAGGGV